MEHIGIHCFGINPQDESMLQHLRSKFGSNVKIHDTTEITMPADNVPKFPELFCEELCNHILECSAANRHQECALLPAVEDYLSGKDVYIVVLSEAFTHSSDVGSEQWTSTVRQSEFTNDRSTQSVRIDSNDALHNPKDIFRHTVSVCAYHMNISEYPHMVSFFTTRSVCQIKDSFDSLHWRSKVTHVGIRSDNQDIILRQSVDPAYKNLFNTVDSCIKHKPGRVETDYPMTHPSLEDIEGYELSDADSIGYYGDYEEYDNSF